MDIIDVSPDDLVLPGGCLGWAVLDGWTGPVYRSMSLDHRNWKPVAMHCGAVPVTYGGWQHYLDEACPPLRLDCRRPEVRDRLRRVLAVGGRCRECGAQVASTEDCICNGTGYTRQPHDIGHFIDAEIAGRITPLAAAGLMWASALRVEAGLNPVLGLFGTRFNYGVGPAYVQRNAHGKTIMFLATQAGSDGWLVRDPDTRALLASGSERGLKGVEAADTSALFAGFALLNDDHILLPLPDRIARLRLEG